MEFPGGWELVVLVLLVFVLFGAKRLPDSARALGRSMRIFKAETRGLRDDRDAVVAPTAELPPASAAPAPTAAAPDPEAPQQRQA